MIERTFIQQSLRKLELEGYLKSELIRAGFTKAEIVKTPLVTRIVVHVTTPGLAIGKGGSTIKSLTETIEKKFGIDNPQIEIKEIEVPELDAQVQADRIKNLIERGFSWRSIAYRTVKEISDAGAQGVELLLSGKLSGKGGRKRKQRIAIGYMKKVGDPVKLVDYAKASAYPKAGAIGIKIRIVHPKTVFSDKIQFSELLEKTSIQGKPVEKPLETPSVEEKNLEEKTEVTEKVEEKKEPSVEKKEKKKTEKPKEKTGKKHKEKKEVKEEKTKTTEEIKEEKTVEKENAKSKEVSEKKESDI